MEENEVEQEKKDEPEEQEEGSVKKKSKRKAKRKSISLEPCPHRAIKWVLVDRSAMKQAEYDAFLAKPKWLGKAWYREEKEVKKKPVRRIRRMKRVESDECYRPCDLPKIEKLPRIKVTKEFMCLIRLLIEASFRMEKKVKKKWWRTVRLERNGGERVIKETLPDQNPPPPSETEPVPPPTTGEAPS